MDTPESYTTQHAITCVPEGDFWVFAYGSLMWRPDFPFIEACSGILQGYQRSLCVLSWYHRGTEEKPGLVFGLDRVVPKASMYCEGRVLKVSQSDRETVLSALQARELITQVYQPKMLDIVTNDGTVNALTFVVDDLHSQYAGKKSTEECVEIVRKARGRSGCNIDYVLETWRYLELNGIAEPELQKICERLESLQ